MAIPVMVVMGVLVIWPVINVARLSFFKSDYLTEQWIGFGNYIALAKDSGFWNAVVNSCIYGFAFIAGEVGIGLPFSLMAFDLSQRWRNSLRLLAIVPTTAAGIVISQVWLWIFNPTYGLANWILSIVGHAPVEWLSTRPSATTVMFVMIALTLPGAGIVLLMTALSAIPKEILEAARVDGASPWQTRFRIALPYIRTTLVLAVLIAFIAGMQVWEFVYAMTSGGPGGSTRSLMYFIWETGLLRSKYGMGAAASVFLVTVVSLWSFGITRFRQ
jgi:multiple sugar transport system permease protein